MASASGCHTLEPLLRCLDVTSPASHATKPIETPMVTIGSVVRAPWLPPSNSAPHPRRAVVAVVDQDTASLVWEDIPRPLLEHPFLVVPMVTRAEPRESDVNVAQVQPLLEFETSVPTSDNPRVFKSHGDTLLRLGDAAAAAAYYEQALHLTHQLSIGATVVLREQGRLVTAEVDCRDGDECDLTFKNGDERTVSARSIVLVIQPSDDQLQERILLNLTRCLLQVADTCGVGHRPAFDKAAVLSSTLALTLMGESDASRQTTALVLRCRAQLNRGKFAHARQDAQEVCRLDPQHKEGLRLLQEINVRQQQVAKADKMLAKEVCRWVQAATKDPQAVSEDQSEVRQDEPIPNPVANSSFPWSLILLALLLAYFVQQKLLNGGF